MSASTPQPLHPQHAEHLAQFKIPPEMIEAAGVRSVTDADTHELFGVRGHHGADLGGILLPYNDPLTGRRVGGRVRLDHLLPKGGKYISEPGCRHLFFPPFPKEWLSDTSIPVVPVESEKAALALLALAKRVGRKLIAIALGGCWGWKRKAGKRPLPNGDTEPETGPSPDLDLITWEGRPVIIVLDSNCSTNAKVRSARRALAQELAGRGANVHIADVPAIEGVNGPDDLIAVSGDEAMLSVLDSARLFAECALAEAEQALSEIQADKKTDPLPVIEAIAAVDDPVGRTLLIGRLAALRVSGVNKTLIEKQVAHHRAKAETDRQRATEAARHGRLQALGETIGGTELLDSICLFVQRFVLLSRAQSQVVALWVVHTYAFLVAECTPYLSVTSPEKRSGKTRLLEVLATLVLNPWLTGRVTSAVLYRKIDAESPTLLLDESDAAFKSGEEYAEALRGILNTGHRRGGKTTCCVGQGVKITYQDFSTFSPKAIAGIGKLPDTVADRSVPIRLKRKAKTDKVERFRLRNVGPEADRLREQIEAYVAANIERLRDARPELPEALNDRQQDGAEPLLAIAELAGGEWPQMVRDALIALCTEAQTSDDSIGTRLLTDIYECFQARGDDRISSTELATELASIETSPWGEWNKGKPITPHKLARLLKSFDISPHNIRTDKVLKGYEVSDFEDAWARYRSQKLNDATAPARPETATSLQANTDAGSRGFEAATRSHGVAASEVNKPFENAPCSGVAVSEKDTGPGPEEEL